MKNEVINELIEDNTFENKIINNKVINNKIIRVINRLIMRQ